MQLGMIGLGRMGGNIVRRLMRAGHSCVVFDTSTEAVAALAGEGATGEPRPRRLRRPAGEAARRLGHAAGGRDHRGTIVELGEPDGKPATSSSTAATASTRTTSAARRDARKRKGIHYVDVGTSGGVWGLERGYCMMIGGDKDGRRAARPDLRGAGAGQRRHRAHPRPRGARPAGRAGLSPLRPGRRRPLRQDDPQRHRVRPDAGLRRGLRHPAQRQLEGGCRRTSATSSTSPTSPRSGGAAASSPPGCST